MVTVGMNYDVIAGKEQEFEKVFGKVHEIMTSLPGHSRSNLYRNVAAPRSYLIVSEWTDRAAFDAFTRSDQFKNVVDWGKEKILSSRPRHEIYGSDQPASRGCPVGAH
jgi:heme-degrading monooxygenase HmoA